MIAGLCYIAILLILPSITVAVPPFNETLARWALEFAAAAYAVNPVPCINKNNATMVERIATPCDLPKDECWSFVALTDDWIVVSFRGTQTKLQLITELIESMTAPKKKVVSGGSVQHYFYVAVQSVWHRVNLVVEKLALTYPDRQILFTGHSLGGAMASLASTIFAHRHPRQRNKISLLTFGQPRVGNFDYAQSHDMLVPRSWRVIHKYDLVAHIPLCETTIYHSCTPFFNHGPYHHGIEVWYPGVMNSTSVAYNVCDGTPLNEDDSCSNLHYLHYNILDHIIYYDHHVSDYGEAGCVDPPEGVRYELDRYGYPRSSAGKFSSRVEGEAFPESSSHRRRKAFPGLSSSRTGGKIFHRKPHRMGAKASGNKLFPHEDHYGRKTKDYLNLRVSSKALQYFTTQTFWSVVMRGYKRKPKFFSDFYKYDRV